jgi:hypothetical protein
MRCRERNGLSWIHPCGTMKNIGLRSGDESVLRLSVDAKATVVVGPFSRHGRSRVVEQAADHDFKADEPLTPFGIFLADHDEL